MALFSHLARIGAVGALALTVLAPVSMAEERGRGGHDGGHRGGGNWDGGGHRGGDRGHRGGDWNRGHDNRGDWNRGHDRGNWNRGHDNRNNWNRGGHHDRDWNRHYRPSHNWNHNYYRTYRPRVVNRYYYSAPRYYPRHYSRPSISFHYSNGYYHGGYRVGGYYDYSPRTIIIQDYGSYGLYRPPHGYHWVRDPYGQDAILTSVATGAIIGLAVGILSQ